MMGLFQTIPIQNKLLLILFLGALVFLIFHFKSSDLGNYIGIGGLVIALWQFQDSQESKTEGAIAKVKEDLEGAIAKVSEDSDKRDFYHEQQLSQIQRELTLVSNQLGSHQVNIARLSEHIFENKDKLAEHGAILAVLTKQGEIILAINNMRDEFVKLQSEFDLIRQQKSATE